MRKKNVNVNIRKFAPFVCSLVIFFLISNLIVLARDAEFEDGYTSAKTAPKNSYQKILESNEDTVRKVLDLFGTDPSEYETIPTAATQPAEVTPTTQPQYGPLPQGTTNLSQIIGKMTEVVYRNCTTFGTGIIKVQNSYCVDPIKNLFSDTRGIGVVKDLKYSATTYYNLQCVGCAVAMSNLNSSYYGGIGNAKQHIGQQVSGYTYYSSFSSETARKVVPGSFFVMGGGTYGHIGTVTETNKDVTGKVISFRTQECNVITFGHFEYGRNRTIAEVSGFQIPN